MVILLVAAGVILAFFGGWECLDALHAIYTEGASAGHNGMLLLGAVTVLAGLACFDIAWP